MKNQIFTAWGLVLALYLVGVGTPSFAAQVPDKLPLGSVAAALTNAIENTEGLSTLLAASPKPLSEFNFGDGSWTQIYAKGTIISGTASNFSTVTSNAVVTSVGKALTASPQHKDGSFHSLLELGNFDGITFLLQTNSFALIKNPDNSYSLPPGVNELVINYDNLHNFVWKQVPGMVWAKVSYLATGNDSEDVADTRVSEDGVVKIELDYLAIHKLVACNVSNIIVRGTVEIGLGDGTTVKYDLRTGNKVLPIVPSLAVVYTNGIPKITIRGEPGTVLKLQATPDLVTWNDLSTETIGANGTVEHQCPLPPPARQFYRLVSP